MSLNFSYTAEKQMALLIECIKYGILKGEGSTTKEWKGVF